MQYTISIVQIVKNKYTKKNNYDIICLNDDGLNVDNLNTYKSCLDETLGNIFNNTLEEIISSERYQNLKKSFQDRKPCEELCKSCTFKERFK